MKYGIASWKETQGKGRIPGKKTKNRRAARQDQEKHTRIVGISGKKKRAGKTRP